MTAGKIAHEYNGHASKKFIMGASLVSIFYCFVATQFSFYIQTNPNFVQALYKVGAFIFGILTVYYIWKAIAERKGVAQHKPDRNNFFMTGMFLSFLNILPIPFYTGISILIAELGYFHFYKLEILLLIISVGLGTQSVLAVYAKYYSKFASKRIQKVGTQKRITANHILGVITLVITLMALFKLNFSIQ